MSATPKDLPPWDCPDQVYPRAARIVREYLEKLDRVNPDGSSGEDIERDLMEPISQLEQELERVNALLARIKERERTNTRYADEDWMREVTPVAHLISTIEALSVCLHDEESAGWKMKMRTDLCWQEVTIALQTLRIAAEQDVSKANRVSESVECPPGRKADSIREGGDRGESYSNLPEDAKVSAPDSDTPVPAAPLRDYPNLEAIYDGRMAGEFRDWIAVRGELRRFMAALRVKQADAVPEVHQGHETEARSQPAGEGEAGKLAERNGVI